MPAQNCRDLVIATPEALTVGEGIDERAVTHFASRNGMVRVEIHPAIKKIVILSLIPRTQSKE